VKKNKFKYDIEKLCVIKGYDKNPLFINTYYWCLIGIGKHFINKNKFPIKEEEFIEKAIENIDYEVKKIEDRIEINHYKRIMESLKTNDLEFGIMKRPIMKDATASINQIFMKELGPINQDSLNYVNLGRENE
jgi:hypothetical protein